MNEPRKKRGRKPKDYDLDEFLESSASVAFAPSRLTREHFVYGMRETGILNRSAYLAWALKTCSDMLLAEAQRRQRSYDLEHPDLERIDANNYEFKL